MVKWIGIIALIFGVALAGYWFAIGKIILGLIFSVLDIFLVAFLILESKFLKGGEDIEYVES